jgi:hypothetical protein
MQRYNGKEPILDMCYCFENGVVQVADINESGYTVICSVNLNTSLTGLSIAKRICPYAVFSSYYEIVASTYSGGVMRIYNSQNEDKETKQIKIQDLEKELLALRKKLTTLKSKHKEPIIEKALEVCKINANLKSIPERSAHILSIESQETIVICSFRK